MPILNDISKKFGGAAKTAAKMSGEIVEVTKLNRAISLDEEKLNKIYIELGKALYLKYEKGDSFAGDDLVAWCRQISDLNEEIGYYKEKILQLKNIKLCPNCKNEVGPDVLFCPKCGTKIEANQPDAEDGE